MSTVVPRITPTYTDLAVAGGAVRVAQIHLPGVPRGAVILLCESHGLGGQAVELMNGLAEHGYESIAADISAIGLDSLHDDEAVLALRDLVTHVGLRGWDHEQIGIVGYGFGGRVALLAAAELNFGAAVSVSPDGVTRATDTRPALMDTARPVATPWLGMFGANDEAAPRHAVLALADRLTESSPAYTEFVTYPGVVGDFFYESAEVLGSAAMFDSWQRVIEWLNLRVVPRPSPYAEIWSLRETMSG